MNFCEATAHRINQLLTERKMTMYRLEIESGISHGSMDYIINQRNKNITLKSIALIAKGFNMSLIEFLDAPVFIDAFKDAE